MSTRSASRSTPRRRRDCVSISPGLARADVGQVHYTFWLRFVNKFTKTKRVALDAVNVFARTVKKGDLCVVFDLSR